jgi:Superinfection immunity protein
MNSPTGSVIASLLLVGAIVMAYMFPTFIACIRRVPNTGSVAIINIFLGWTFIGWVVALAMAASSSRPSVTTYVSQTGPISNLPRSAQTEPIGGPGRNGCRPIVRLA